MVNNTNIAGNGAYKVIHELFGYCKKIEVLSVSFNFFGSEGDGALERSEKLKSVKIQNAKWAWIFLL